jgi:hypothetical protein
MTTRARLHKEIAFDEWLIHQGIVTDATGRHPIIRFEDVYFLKQPMTSSKQSGTQFLWLAQKHLKVFFKNMARYMYKKEICEKREGDVPAFDDCIRVVHYHVDMDKEYIRIPFADTYQSIKKMNIKHPYTIDLELYGVENTSGMMQYRWRLIQITLQDIPSKKCMISYTPEIEDSVDEVWPSEEDNESDEEPAAADIEDLIVYGIERLCGIEHQLSQADDKIAKFRNEVTQCKANINRVTSFKTLQELIECIDRLEEGAKHF